MFEPARSDDTAFLTQKLQDAATSSPAFDRDLAVKIGKCIAARRNFCELSTPRQGERLGIDSMELESYEQGKKRMSCRLLLETVKQLKAKPRSFNGHGRFVSLMGVRSGWANSKASLADAAASSGTSSSVEIGYRHLEFPRWSLTPQ